RLHHDLEASLEAEHRHWWRGWRRASTHRLVGRDELTRLDTGVVVPRHLHLDAAALLGAGRSLPRRLRGGARAHAARRGVTTSHHAGDSHLLGLDVGAHADHWSECASWLGLRG